ncbi:hypothetical protein TWF706_004704 [Orbilia oligospora]|nr:hypothetical protein TWF706_004704 [Orbilia oligospora]
MASCAQCRLSDRKKKCTPESRAWPDQRCDYCVKSGYPCSEFMSKKQLTSISEAERAQLLVKEKLRSPVEIISELDCLLYLREEAQRFEAQFSKRYSERGVRGTPNEPGGHYFVQRASRQIGEALGKVLHEAQRTFPRLILNGDTPNAYILGALTWGKISYHPSCIRTEYQCQCKCPAPNCTQGPMQASLDAAAGLNFRRFKGLELMSQKWKGPGEYPSKITSADISELYKILVAVSQVCGGCAEHTPRYRSLNNNSAHVTIFANNDILRKLCPLFLTVFLLNKERINETDITDWPQTIVEAGSSNIDDFDGEATVHMAAAAYFLNKSLFFEVIRIIRVTHFYDLLNLEDKAMNDAPVRLAILLRRFDAFERLFDLYDKYELYSRPAPPGYAAYRLAPPGPQYNQLPDRLPLTAFMVAISLFHLEDSLSLRFVDYFFRLRPLCIWDGPAKVLLSSVLNTKFAQDADISLLELRPIHLAGFMKKTKVFKKLLSHGNYSSNTLTIAMVAVYHDDATLFPLLSCLFRNNMELRESKISWVMNFVKRYGSERLVHSLDAFFDTQDWFTRGYLQVNLSNQNLYTMEHDPPHSDQPSEGNMATTREAGGDIQLPTQVLGGELPVRRNSTPEILESIEGLGQVLVDRQPLLLETDTNDSGKCLLAENEAILLAPSGSEYLTEGVKDDIASRKATNISQTSSYSTFYSEKSALSIGGMPFLVTSSRNLISDTNNARKRRRTEEHEEDMYRYRYPSSLGI